MGRVINKHDLCKMTSCDDCEFCDFGNVNTCNLDTQSYDYGAKNALEELLEEIQEHQKECDAVGILASAEWVAERIRECTDN